MMAKPHGVQPGATLRENPPVSHRYRLSAVKPKNCMSISVRNAPMRREEKRAEKSATPQPNAADIPRRISKWISLNAGRQTQQTQKRDSSTSSAVADFPQNDGHFFFGSS